MNTSFRPFSATRLALLAAVTASLVCLTPATAHAQIIVNGTAGISEHRLSGQPLETPLITSTNVFGSFAVSGSNLFIVIDGGDLPGDASIGEYNTSSGVPENETLITGLDDPFIAVSDDGSTLFVVDIADSTVSSYDSTTGLPIQAPMISNLPGPDCVAVAGSNLFVLNTNYLDDSGTTGSIGLYKTDGTPINPALITGLDGPQFLALSGSEIHVRATGLPGPGYDYSFEGTVSEYTVSGTNGVTVKAGLIHGITTPQVLAVSGTDIFVTDNLQLDEFNTSGFPWQPLIGPEFLPFATNAIVILPLTPLPAATLQVTGPGAPGGPLFFTVDQSQPGVTVSIEYSLDNMNWSPLPGAGNLAGSGGVYTTGANGTTSYPSGATVYFRAISSENGFTDNISNETGPFTLQQALLKLTLIPDVTEVAPGGFINYTGTITNLATYLVHNVVVAIPVPPFTRFVPYDPSDKLGTTFLNPKGHAFYPFPGHALESITTPLGQKNVSVANPLRFNGSLPHGDLPPEVQQFLSTNPPIIAPPNNADQAVFYVGELQEHGVQRVRLTVQAQYVYPDTVPNLEITATDYLGYSEDGSGNLLGSQENGSGGIVSPLEGQLVNAPSLSLSKQLSTTTRSPGQPFLVVLMATNHSLTAGNDVVVTDTLPPGVPLMTPNYQAVVASDAPEALLKSAVVFLGKSSSIKTSEANYFVWLDSGNVLHIGGLHLEPGASVEIGYVAQIPANASIPSTLISGNSSIGAGGGNETIVGTGANEVSETVPSGTPSEIPIQVTASSQLLVFQPSPLVNPLFVSANPITTGSALDEIYKLNKNAAPYVAGTNPPQFIPGVQSYLMQYAVTGTSVATDVHLQFGTPPNTVFYRAAFMSRTEDGYIAAPGKGQSIFEPAPLGTGTTTFNFGNLKGGDTGEVMVEVICTSSAVQLAGSPGPTATPVIFSGAGPLISAASAAGNSVVYDGMNVPRLGLMKVAPQAVAQGQNFSEQFVLMNSGTVGLTGSCIVQMEAPPGTQIVSVATAQGVVQDQTASDFSVAFDPLFLGPWQAAGLTVTLTATGAPNTTIIENSIVANVPYAGALNPGSTSIQIIPADSAASNATTTIVSGIQYATVGELTIIPIGHNLINYGYAVVSGPSQFIGVAPLTVAPSANGNAIVAGLASNIPLLNLPVVNNTDANSALLQLVTITQNQGGNIVNGPGANLVTLDGENLVNNSTGAVLGKLSPLAPQSLLPSDTGFVALTGGTNAAAVLGGIIFVHGSGFVVTAQGGEISREAGKLTSLYGALISAEFGGLIGQDGSEVVSYSGSTLISSPISNTVIQTPAGNIITSGIP